MEIKLFFQKIKRYVPTLNKEELKEISTLSTKLYVQKETAAMSSECCPAIGYKPTKCAPPVEAKPYTYAATTTANYIQTCNIPTGTTITLDDLAYAKQCLAKASYPVAHVVTVGSCEPNNKKDDNMSLNSTADLEIQQRNFLKTRIRDLEMEKRTALRKHFNMDYRFTPKTKDELLEALKNVTIKANTDYFTKTGENKYGYAAADLLYTIEFVDPKSPKDEDGYNAAREELRTAQRDLEDTITVKPLTEAVEAFEAFKKATFH